MGIKMGELMINIYSPLLPQKPQQQASPLVSGLPRKQPRSSNLYVYIQKQFQIGTGKFRNYKLHIKRQKEICYWKQHEQDELCQRACRDG